MSFTSFLMNAITRYEKKKKQERHVGRYNTIIVLLVFTSNINNYLQLN